MRRLELDGLDLRLRVAGRRRAVDRGRGRCGRDADRPAGRGAGARGRRRPRRSDPGRRRGHGRRRSSHRPADARQRPFQDRQRSDAALGRLRGFRARLRSFRPRRSRDLGDRAGGPLDDHGAGVGGDAPALSIEARDLSLADLETFDKKPPPLFAEGPIAFKFDARLAPEATIRTLTGRFSIGAGHVRINNPDALPFLIDEATGGADWDDGAKRLRIDKLDVLAGETLVGARAGSRRRPTRRGAWTTQLESQDMQFGPERAGDNAVALNSIVFDARYFLPRSRFVVDGLTARGPTVDAVLKAEVAPDGEAPRSSSALTPRPSATPDVIRLWPQFINPDVRDWCAHNLHGGQLEGAMMANWTAADLDAMAHKRGLPRESVHGEFTTHGVGVDLMPGLPMMMRTTARDPSPATTSASPATRDDDADADPADQATTSCSACRTRRPAPIVDAPRART